MMVELKDSQYKNKFAKIKTKIHTIPALNDFDIIVIHIQMDTNWMITANTKTNISPYRKSLAARAGINLTGRH